MQSHLDVRLSHLREEKKRLELAFIPSQSLNPQITEAFAAIRSNDQEKVKELVLADRSLVHSLDTVPSIQTQKSLLHWACKRKLELLGIFLVEHGADVGKKDLGGRVPRELAKREGLERLSAYIQKHRPVYNSKLHSTLFVKKAARRLTGKVREKIRF